MNTAQQQDNVLKNKVTIHESTFMTLDICSIQINDRDWAEIMRARCEKSCKEPIPEWFIKKHWNKICFDGFESLVLNHTSLFTDDFLKEFSMFLVLYPTFAAAGPSAGLARLKKLFYSGKIQDVTIQDLNANPQYYDRFVWEAVLQMHEGILPADFVARHLNRISMFHLIANVKITNRKELLDMFSMSAGKTKVCPDGTRITELRNYPGKRYLCSVARFDTNSSAQEETNKEYAEKILNWFPAALVTSPTDEDVQRTLASAITKAKRCKYDISSWGSIAGPGIEISPAPAPEDLAATEPGEQTTEIVDALKDLKEGNGVLVGVEPLKNKIAELLKANPDSKFLTKVDEILSLAIKTQDKLRSESIATQSQAVISVFEEALPTLGGTFCPMQDGDKAPVSI